MIRWIRKVIEMRRARYRFRLFHNPSIVTKRTIKRIIKNTMLIQNWINDTEELRVRGVQLVPFSNPLKGLVCFKHPSLSHKTHFIFSVAGKHIYFMIASSQNVGIDNNDIGTIYPEFVIEQLIKALYKQKVPHVSGYFSPTYIVKGGQNA